MKYFYTSDTHINHANILNFCPVTRNFENISVMNSTIISNWNKKVSNNDTVFHLGDWAFGSDYSFLDQLNGKIITISGNHDHKFLKHTSHRFEKVTQYMTIKDGDENIFLCHFRMYVWDQMHRGSKHFHGHTHGSLQNTRRAIDVGLDNPDMNFSPCSLDEINLFSSSYIEHPEPI